MPSKSKAHKDKKRKPSGPASPASPSDSLDDKKLRIDSYFISANLEPDSDRLSEASFCSADETIADETLPNMSLTKADIPEIATQVKTLMLPELKLGLKEDMRELFASELTKLRDSLNAILQDNNKLKLTIAEMEPLKDEVASLRNENATLRDSLENLELSIDRQEQYSRRDCLRINGVPGDTGDYSENTDEKIMQMAEAANIPLQPMDIDKSHRLGKFRPEFSVNRTVIVKFTNSKARDRVMDARKSVGGIYINEDLSRYRQNLAFESRKLVRENKLEQSWVGRGGIIFAKFPGGDKFQIASKRDIESVKQGKLPRRPPT
ncbi:MAG: hypothetical protein ABW185_23235 [Sedimenticola sp.]